MQVSTDDFDECIVIIREEELQWCANCTNLTVSVAQPKWVPGAVNAICCLLSS
jgi:hypothetical protein